MNDDDTQPYVRLVLVADYDLLNTMLLPGKERLQTRAAGLYLRVAPTCPAYYALWDSNQAVTSHEVLNGLKRGAPRDVLLDTMKDNVGGKPSPVKLNVYKTIRSTNPGGVVLVNPGVSVVRGGWCDMLSDGGAGV